jgi:hypothetical protein
MEAKAKPPPDYSFAQPYVRPRDGRPALIADIDGTTFRRTTRGIHDYHRVSEDVPHDDVVRLVRMTFMGMRRAYHEQQPCLLWVSGRPDTCRTDTAAAIRSLALPDDYLFMRPEFRPGTAKRDFRPDYEVKYEIFDREIRGKYDVLGAYDDRLQVVNLWRHLGILCLDVAGGAF